MPNTDKGLLSGMGTNNSDKEVSRIHGNTTANEAVGGGAEICNPDFTGVQLYSQGHKLGRLRAVTEAWGMGHQGGHTYLEP